MHTRPHDCLSELAVQVLGPSFRDSHYLPGHEENPQSGLANNIPGTVCLKGCRNMSSVQLPGHMLWQPLAWICTCLGLLRVNESRQGRMSFYPVAPVNRVASVIFLNIKARDLICIDKRIFSIGIPSCSLGNQINTSLNLSAHCLYRVDA